MQSASNMIMSAYKLHGVLDGTCHCYQEQKKLDHWQTTLKACFQVQGTNAKRSLNLVCDDTFDAGIPYACWHCLHVLHEKGITAAASSSFPHTSTTRCLFVPSSQVTVSNTVHIVLPD